MSAIKEWSFDDTEFSRFGLHAPQNEFDLASEIAQNGKDWASAKNWDIAKGYTDADIDIVMRCGLARQPGNYDLIFSAIPCGRRVTENRIRPSSLRKSDKFRIFDMNSGSDNGSMLVGITKFIECPKGRIASSIRLEPFKERFDFIRDVLGLAFDVVVKFPARATKRKVDIPSLTLGNDGACTMVKSGAKIFQSGNGQFRKVGMQSALESNFVDYVNTISIHLGKTFIRLRRKEAQGEVLEIKDILLCPSHAFYSRRKLSGHDLFTGRHSGSIPESISDLG